MIGSLDLEDRHEALPPDKPWALDRDVGRHARRDFSVFGRLTMSDTSADPRETRAAVRLMRETLVAGVIYAAAYVAALWAIKTLDPPQWQAALITFVPVLLALLMLRAELRYLHGLDEMKRRMHSEAVVMATGALLVGALAYGSLEDMAGFPHFSLWWVFPIFCVLQCAANLIVYFRYR
jgi:hypothetical protein